MKGDFSKWGLDPADNFSGVLHQQGRVLLDQDWNASQQIQSLWRQLAGRDIVGAGLVAVPAADPDGLRILSATASAAGVEVTLQPGRAWVDGLHYVRAAGTPLRASYLQPPLQSPAGTVAGIAAGVRDALILEVWDEAYSAYQDPLKLLEPALGGPDTTERMQTSMALRLLRLDDDQGCGGLPIDDAFATKGRLTVTPSPTVVVPGPCPVPESGGYSGFEHFLYRIEIAEPGATGPRFKWSQFNGGLVGRGAFTATGAGTGDVAITANNPMINQCGLESFYLEALAFDAAAGHWQVQLRAQATLSAADTLQLTGITGTWPGGSTAFFRLWNGIEAIADYLVVLPMARELPDQRGVRLAFDAPTADGGNYAPGDYWTFPARAAGVDFDPSTWPNAAPPQGVHHHRAALGILEWSGAASAAGVAATLHDCRQVFLPLARQRGCCTVTVGDGHESFGQYRSIRAALDALPPSGGTVCVLPGRYDESVLIEQRVDVRIHGCGPRTRVRARADDDGTERPAFLVSDSAGICLESMAIEAGPRSAVEITNARDVAVRDCLVQMRDVPTLWQAIFSRGDDITLASNIIEVLPREASDWPVLPLPKPGDPDAPAGVNSPPAAVVTGHATRGGIQIGGGSDRVRILDNHIRGGIWNGITLGSLVEVGGDPDRDLPDQPGSADPCDPCRPADLGIDDDPTNGRPRFLSAGDLYDVEIRGNRITDMGINGIGVVRFFGLQRGGDLVGVHGLHIRDNLISRCLRRDIKPAGGLLQWLIGYGGIALAKVSDLRILDNEITYNGGAQATPVCGVFALMVQGLQVHRNRILDNGPESLDGIEKGPGGMRGGVHVWVVLPGDNPPEASAWGKRGLRRSKTHSGQSACTVHDNLVVAPLGRALTFFALGPVVVARNRLVSQGNTGRDLDLLAGTVLVGNLGISNEWTQGLLLALVLQLLGLLPDLAKGEYGCAFAKVLGLVDPGPPTTFWPPLSRRWATGKTLFTENQVTMDVSEQPIGFNLCSVAVLSLDDVGLVDNQFEFSSTRFFQLSQVVVLAGSARLADNRFSETWLRAGFSAMSLAGMNTTTDNQSTHCLMAMALLPGQRVFRDNLSLVHAFCPGDCGYD